MTRPGSGPTHYELLGVAPNASAAEIRRAYLALARRHHPDVHPAGSPARSRAEEEMRRLNAAWSTIGDGERRRRYDVDLAARSGDAPSADAPRPPWRPFDDGDIEEPDDPRLDDSAYAPAPGGRGLVLGPSLLVVIGLVAGGLGLVSGLRVAIAVALIAFALAALTFVAAPFAAVFESRRRDRL